MPIIYNSDFVHELNGFPLGPYYRVDGEIYAVEGQGIWKFDSSKTSWSSEGNIDFGEEFLLDGVRSALTTKEDTTLIFSPNVSPQHTIWKWNDRTWNSPEARAHGMVLRKPKLGEWATPSTIVDGYCAAIQSVIQLPSGRVVAAAQKFIPKMSGSLSTGGHTVALAAFSDDDGKTWRTSAAISPYDCHPRPSFHAKGNHGGLMEPAIVQFGDDKVLMLIRTNWGEFWTSISMDGGENWSACKPSGIPASAAPCALLSVKQGILIIWNRPYASAPKGGRRITMVGGGIEKKGIINPTFSEVPVSFHGGELSAAIVDPENLQTWRETVATVAWVENIYRGALKYPKAFMFDANTVWVTTSPAANPAKKKYADEKASCRLSLNVSSLIR